ncbi:hypothetical protein SHAb15599_00053 [Acinetobacter phage SH-Ab 15599]|nr:hypothetical protein SHAb15599_00053 [Acinetobacter phage SH-Ab 15599]
MLLFKEYSPEDEIDEGHYICLGSCSQVLHLLYEKGAWKYSPTPNKPEEDFPDHIIPISHICQIEIEQPPEPEWDRDLFRYAPSKRYRFLAVQADGKQIYFANKPTYLPDGSFVENVRVEGCVTGGVPIPENKWFKTIYPHDVETVGNKGAFLVRRS